jgi:glycerophosphoryl diester phosphodiesterase
VVEFSSISTAPVQLFKKLLKGVGYTLFSLIMVGITVYFVVTAYVNYQLEHPSEYQAYDSCQKVWSSRGTYIEWKDQNSIESVRTALLEGAGGVEIDLRFDTELKKFIISHDYPYNLKNGKLLSLQELLDAVGDFGYFWLDYKNLRLLSSEQTQEAIVRLKEISARGDLRERIYIEGVDPIKLPLYRQAGFHTIFDTQPPKDSLPVTAFVMNIYKAAFYFGGHTVMGMAYGSVEEPIYGPDTQKGLGNIPVFLYHVPNDDELLDRLVASKEVRAILVGRDRSAGRFEKNLCSTAQENSSSDN